MCTASGERDRRLQLIDNQIFCGTILSSALFPLLNHKNNIN
jgi:hypothetical protein